MNGEIVWLAERCAAVKKQATAEQLKEHRVIFSEHLRKEYDWGLHLMVGFRLKEVPDKMYRCGYYGAVSMDIADR